jgi:hypothetical protein
MAIVFRREPRCEKAHLAVVAFFSLWYVYHRTYDSVSCILPAAFFIDLLVRKRFRVFAAICLSALGLLAVSIPGLLTERLHLQVASLSANPLGFLGLQIERILIFGLFWSLLIFLWRVGPTDRAAKEQFGALAHPSFCNV